jgi:branched-chain amino acid transport system substrate-binding protein
VLAPASTYLGGALAAIRAADAGGTVASVLLVRAAAGFASDVADGVRAAAAAHGFSLDEVVFESGKALAACATATGADVLCAVGRFEDERAIAGALLDGRRWRAAVFVGAGTDEVLSSLGDAREGLIGPAQWLAEAAPEPQVGPEASWFVAAYEKATGAEPPYPAAQAFAAGLLAARCWHEGATDADVVAAAEELETTTLYGRVRLDPETGLQIGHEVLTVQWQDGQRRVVWPPERAERPLVLAG